MHTTRFTILSTAILLLFSANVHAQNAPGRAPSFRVPADSGELYDAALSADGKLLACSFAEGETRVYQVGNAKPILTCPSAQAEYPQLCVGLSADGKWLATVASDESLEIRSVETGKLRVTAEIPPPNAKTFIRRVASCDRLAFSPDGSRLALVCGFLYHKELFIFDAANGKLLAHPLRDVDGAAYQLTYSADGKWLVANHVFQTYLIDTKTNQLKHTYKQHFSAVHFDRNTLLGVPLETLQVVPLKLDGSLGEPRATLGNSQASNRIGVTGPPSLAAITFEETTSIRDANGKELFQLPLGTFDVRQIDFSADGKTLLLRRHEAGVELYTNLAPSVY